MQIQLGNEEKIIREWNYAEIKEAEANEIQSLILTSKRIIIGSKTKSGCSREEIPTSSVTGISTKYEEKRNVLAGVLLIVLGAVFAISSIFTMNEHISALEICFIVFGIIIALCGIIAIANGLKADFTVLIYTNVNQDNYIGISAGSLTLKTRSKTTAIQVKVNIAVAKEIVDTLGSYLLAR